MAKTVLQKQDSMPTLFLIEMNFQVLKYIRRINKNF